MGSIPLPALALKPMPEQPNALEQYSRLVQLQQQQKLMPGQLQQQQQTLQAGQQENQQREMDMNSQKALMRAYEEAGGNLDKAVPLAAKYGAKPDAVIKLREASMNQQKQNIELLNAKGARAIQEADLMQGAHDAVAAAKPEDRPGLYQQQLAGLQQAGVDISQAPPQYPGDEQFKLFGLGIKGHKQQLEDLFKQAETAKNQAQAGKDTAEQKMIEQYGGTGVENRELADFLQKNPGKGPMDFAAAKAKLAPQAQLIVANSQGGGLKDAALDNAAEKYWSTGNLPAGGRGPAVMAQNQKIMNRAAELHSGESITAGTAAYAANKRSLESLQKNVDQVDGFERTAGKNLDVFLAQAQKVIDSGNPLINRPLRTIVGSMGGADQAAFDAARTTALTEIAKVLSSSNASGVLSDSARHEVESLIKPNANLQQIVSAANILKTDMANRHDSYQQQLDDIKGRMSGGKSTNAPAKPQSAPAKTLSMSQIQQAAKDHGVSVDEAKKQAIAAGYQVK